MNKINGDDIIIWPDNTWCTGDELEDFLTFMSDDYYIVPFDSPFYCDVCRDLGY